MTTPNQPTEPIPTDPAQLTTMVVGRLLQAIAPFVEARDASPDGMVSVALAGSVSGITKLLQHDLSPERKALAEQLADTILQHLLKAQ